MRCKQTKIKSLQDQTSLVPCVRVYMAPTQTQCFLFLPSTFPHPDLVDFVYVGMLLWSWDPGLTCWGRSRLVQASVTILSLPPPPSPNSIISCFIIMSCFYVIKRSPDTFTVPSDYINPEVHGGRGLIMVVSYTNQLIMLAVVNRQSEGKEQTCFTSQRAGKWKKGVKCFWQANCITNRKAVMSSLFRLIILPPKTMSNNLDNTKKRKYWILSLENVVTKKKHITVTTNSETILFC